MASAYPGRPHRRHPRVHVTRAVSRPGRYRGVRHLLAGMPAPGSAHRRRSVLRYGGYATAFVPPECACAVRAVPAGRRTCRAGHAGVFDAGERPGCAADGGGGVRGAAAVDVDRTRTGGSRSGWSSRRRGNPRSHTAVPVAAARPDPRASRQTAGEGLPTARPGCCSTAPACSWTATVHPRRSACSRTALSGPTPRNRRSSASLRSSMTTSSSGGGGRAAPAGCAPVLPGVRGGAVAGGRRAGACVRVLDRAGPGVRVLLRGAAGRRHRAGRPRGGARGGWVGGGWAEAKVPAAGA